MRRTPILALLALAAVLVAILILTPTPDRTAGTGASPPGDAGPADRVAGGRLDAVLEGCARSGDSLTTQGWVRNGLAETVRYVELRVRWLDATGAELEVEFPEVVGGETLMSGDSAAFRLASPDPRAVDCTAEIQSYDPFF